MQVATLFREATNLLGAGMESSESTSLKVDCYRSSNGGSGGPANSLAGGYLSESIKQECLGPGQDDGYETGGPTDLDLPHHQAGGAVQHSEESAHHGQPPPHHGQPPPHHGQPPPHHHHHHHHHTHHHMLVSKMESGGLQMSDDPYSFVDDEQQQQQQQHQQAMSAQQAAAAVAINGGNPLANVATNCQPMGASTAPPLQHTPKKRGRKKKIKTEDVPQMMGHTQHGMGYQGLMSCLPNSIKDASTAKIVKERKKHDRFNGMPEEEVSKRTLPDHLTQNLDIVIIGINPGLFAAYKGHHYAGPGNHFWKCLYLSGLTPEPMTADDDYKLLKVGIGFTNMVERATKGSADLTRKEIKEGSQILLEKLQKFKPKIAVFNGKLIFEVFSGKKDFSFGRQPELVDGTNTYMWVMPSSSARCAQLPRAADKVPFYAALKKFRDYLNGAVSEIDDKELVFSYSRLKNFFEPEIKEDKVDGCMYSYNKVNELTDISNLKRDCETGDVVQVKKKRGRPKKIKVEGQPIMNQNIGQKTEEPKIKLDEKTGIPKKKRGRPKKIKVENEAIVQQPSEHSNPPSHCFSPPIQSPSMQFPIYPQQHYSQSSQSPLPGNYHQSHYNHSSSPQQPPSFTHSDLSSEISAAISSEQNPDSPTLGPPDFDPPANMNEDVSKSPERKDDDCHFSSPQSKKSYQYDEFSTDSDSGVRYPQKTINQDVSSKSLSGLESLVDQIPNIGDNESNAQTSNESEQMGSQYSEDSAYLSDYPRSAHFSPQYNTTTTNSYLTQHSNFSVTSLANSSSTTDNTFSVNSITGNYTSPTYNLMGPPPIVELDSSVPCRLDSSRNGLPYPYQYPTPYTQNTAGFYPSAHNIHVPSPNFPYAPPYANSYPQPSYISNHMFDRIKTDRMDIGFGSF